MKYLGIDYGSHTVGIAVSDDRGTIAFPHTTLRNDDSLLDALLLTINKEKAVMAIMGDTRTLSGTANTVTKEADAFATALETKAAIPVVRQWEAWSTFEATRFAPKGKEHDDAAAAAVILQRYLDLHDKKV